MPVPQVGKMSAYRLNFYLFIYPAPHGFQASLLPDNIILNPANKKTDKSHFDFQTGIGIAVHATLDTKQVISHTRTALVDTIASLLGSDGGMITAFEMHELLSKIHDILDSAVSRWVVIWLIF